MADWELQVLDHTGVVERTLKPNDLKWSRHRNEPGDIEWRYTIHDPIKLPADSIGPYRKDYKLMRNGSRVARGIITAYEIDPVEEMVRFEGKSYLHYLERRHRPYALGNPRFLRVRTAVETVVHDLLVEMRDVDPYALDFTISTDTTGQIVSYRIDFADTSFIQDHIKNLAQQTGFGIGPGFDYDINGDKVFKLWYPDRFTSEQFPTIYDLSPDVFIKHHPFRGLTFRNTGPKGTHVLGQGQNLGGSSIFANRSFDASAAVFRRLDDPVNFGQINSPDQVVSLTSSQLALDANPVHEIPLSVDVRLVEEVLGIDFYEKFFPGYLVNITYDLVYHKINSLQWIISMNMEVTNQGDEICTFGLNQWYDLSSFAGIDEP